MGGNKTCRVFLSASDDVVASLLSVKEGGPVLERGLRDLIHDRYDGKFQVEMILDRRSDLLLQQMAVVPFAEGSRQFLVPLFTEQIHIVVFSLQPEVAHPLWRHRQSGSVVRPHPGWEREWPAPEQEWFRDQFEPIGLIDVQQFRDSYVRLIRILKERVNAHIIVYNCSSFDQDDHVHNYHGHPETLSLRVHEFNLALMQISASEGISIIDVDRLLGELGTNCHVIKALHYSLEAYQAIRLECLRVMEDLGCFEDRRPGVQIGQGEN